MKKILYILVIIVLFNVRAFAQFNQLNLDTTLNYSFNNSQVGGLFLNNPANFKTNIIYDPSLNLYFFENKIGTLRNGLSKSFSFDEYNELQNQKILSDYWNNKSKQRLLNNKSFFWFT